MQFALLVYESPEALAARNNDKTDPYIGAWRILQGAGRCRRLRRGRPSGSARDRNYGPNKGRKAESTGRPLG
jgi:hypothetical protein